MSKTSQRVRFLFLKQVLYLKRWWKIRDPINKKIFDQKIIVVPRLTTEVL